MTYLEQIKMLLGIKDNNSDGLLSFILDDTVSLILGYCRIEEIPPKLESAVPVIAADMCRRKGYGSEAAPEYVKEVSQGKRSVKMENGTLDTDAFLREYHNRLRPFINRKGRVPSDNDR